jgi:hypothetical protein
MSAAEKPRSYDEWCYGRDGEGGPGEAIRDSLVKAKGDKLERVEIELRCEPPGGISRQITTERFSVDIDAPTIVDVIRRKLDNDPGPGWFGEVRVNIRKPGEAQGRLGSYTRTIANPAGKAAENTTGKETPTGGSEKLMVPWSDVSGIIDKAFGYAFRGLDESMGVIRAAAENTRAGAEVVKAFAQPVAQASGGGDGLIPSIVGRAIGAAIESDGNPAKAAAKEAARGVLNRVPSAQPRNRVPGAGGPDDTPRLRPDTGSPDPAPSGDGEGPITMDRVREWARNNPGEAEVMVKEAIASKLGR